MLRFLKFFHPLGNHGTRPKNRPGREKSRSEVVSAALGKYYVMKQWEELREYGSKQAKRLNIRTEDDVDLLVHEHRRKSK